MVRLDREGRPPADNPFVNQPGAAPEIYSFGHRNAQGIALDPATGDLLISEHGARGGDEINRIVPGGNYGRPVVTGGIDYQHPVDALTLITLRMLIALPLFAGLAWWAGRGQARLTSRDWLAVLSLGFSGYYLSSLLDFAGLQYISAALERLIFYMSPTIVLVLGFVLHRRAIKSLHWIGAAVSYAGIVLVFLRELNAGGSNLPLGSALVFGSAFFTRSIWSSVPA